MDTQADNSDDRPKNQRVGQSRSPLPALRPYQLAPAEQKARDEKEAADRQERINELRREAEGKPKKGRKLLRFLGWMVLIVVLTAGLGGAGWYYFLREPMNEIQREATAQQTVAPPPPAATSTKHYQSSNFLLEFDYPANWLVTDTTSKLTVVSPAQSLKTASGGSQTGQITVTITARQSTLPHFKTGNAVAARDSEKITYTKPSPAQRGTSYISFLNYADATASGVDALYATGDNGYKEGQAIPQVDVVKSDPLITVTFSGCNDARCTAAGKALTVAPSFWDDTAHAKPVKDLLQSLTVQ